MTKFDKYVPTEAEKKLLQALLNPDNIGIKLKDLCKAARITRQTYYNAMKKPEFAELYHELTMETIKGHAAKALNASFKYADSPQGFQDRKMILTIAGIYVDKSQTEISGAVDVNSRSQEIKDRIKGRLKDG